MVSRGALRLDAAGFSAGELITVLGIIAFVTAVSTPFLMSYWRAATLKAAAEELAAGLNGARELAIARNKSVCVDVGGGKYRYVVGGCAGTVWVGPGTDTDGFFQLAGNITLTANADPVFTYLGAASPGATFTVTNPQGGASLNVVVSGSGRVQVQAAP